MNWAVDDSNDDSNESTFVLSSNGDEELSLTSRPSPKRQPSRHIEFRKYLKRPQQETQRTLSDAMRFAKSREEKDIFSRPEIAHPDVRHLEK